MKKIKTITLLVMFLATTSLYADINNLLKGVVVNDTTLNELSTSTTPNAFAYGISWLGQKSVGGGTVAAFIKIPNSTNLYSFSSSQILYLTNFDTRKLLGNWPLTRWPYQYYSPTTLAQFKLLFMKYPLPFDYERVAPGPGCLGNSPLRYGDIENDGKNELVIILEDLIIIFSPDRKRIVFSEYFDESDWFNAQEKLQYFGNKEIKVAQYVSRLLAENDSIDPGIRAYAKLYFGDFDKDGNSDILAWRKSYISNAYTDPVKGFTKQTDNWQHFERDLKAQADLPAGVTGEYLPQTTDAATIQTWLNDNKLTWQKGYPSISECPGQEGKLIPEMHDPLLNDPDVLK